MSIAYIDIYRQGIDFAPKMNFTEPQWFDSTRYSVQKDVFVNFEDLGLTKKF